MKENNYKAKAKLIYDLVKHYGDGKELKGIIQTELEIAHTNGIIEGIKTLRRTYEPNPRS